MTQKLLFGDDISKRVQSLKSSQDLFRKTPYDRKSSSKNFNRFSKFPENRNKGYQHQNKGYQYQNTKLQQQQRELLPQKELLPKKKN